MQNIFPEHKSEIVLGNGKFQLDPDRKSTRLNSSHSV